MYGEIQKQKWENCKYRVYVYILDQSKTPYFKIRRSQNYMHFKDNINLLFAIPDCKEL